MPSDAIRFTCPACGSSEVEATPIVHHLICAYVGPSYDFEARDGHRCPKCLRALRDHDHAAEIVGESARCRLCETEFVVPHDPVQGA
jgi:transcription elongation factor Elf1